MRNEKISPVASYLSGVESWSGWKTLMSWPGWDRYVPPVAQKPNKYRAKATIVDGIRFDSKKEAARYQELRLEQTAGRISDLTLQPAFVLHACSPDGELVKVCTYVADFQYVRDGKLITEDVKSGPTMTAVYRLKRKIVRVEHGIHILET